MSFLWEIVKLEKKTLGLGIYYTPHITKKAVRKLIQTWRALWRMFDDSKKKKLPVVQQCVLGIWPTQDHSLGNSGGGEKEIGKMER